MSAKSSMYVDPNPDKSVVAKRKSCFIGELNIEDLWKRALLTSHMM
jgi:hypothetical protein